jgi:hypothetical protein
MNRIYEGRLPFPAARKRFPAEILCPSRLNHLFITLLIPTYPPCIDSPTTSKRGFDRFWPTVPPLPLQPTHAVGAFGPPHTQEIDLPPIIFPSHSHSGTDPAVRPFIVAYSCSPIEFSHTLLIQNVSAYHRDRTLRCHPSAIDDHERGKTRARILGLDVVTKIRDIRPTV